MIGSVIMKVLVCGGRDYTNRDLVYSTLDEMKNRMSGVRSVELRNRILLQFAQTLPQPSKGNEDDNQDHSSTLRYGWCTI